MVYLEIRKQYVSSLNILSQWQCEKDVSKSAVIAMGFTNKDQDLIKCSKINRKYERHRLLKMLPDTLELKQNKHIRYSRV